MRENKSFVRRLISNPDFSRLLMAAAPVRADDRRASFRGEATVNVIEVPVHVIDRKTGEPVIGLTAADFEIRENGEPQTLEDLSNHRLISQNASSAQVSAGAILVRELMSYDIGSTGCKTCLYYLGDKLWEYRAETETARVAAGWSPVGW